MAKMWVISNMFSPGARKGYWKIEGKFPNETFREFIPENEINEVKKKKIEENPESYKVGFAEEYYY